MIQVGDCVELMAELDECSVDAIVTDPPYGLEFMGKDWDSMGHGSAQQAWHRRWADQAIRVLKPGGHLVAFGGSRTYHRMASAVEDAGFEIRDQLQWLYGQGFPKSLDVSKAIDKAAGVDREVVGRYASPEGTSGNLGSRQFGSGEPKDGLYSITAPATPEAQRWAGWGTALKPAHEPIVLARKPLVGTVAANVLEWGTGALNVDGTRIATDDLVWNHPPTSNFGSATPGGYAGPSRATPALGRWPANVILDKEAAATLDEQSGNRPGMSDQRDLQHTPSNYFGADKHPGERRGFNDQGGASRFFYCAKASRRERNEGAYVLNIKNSHPTVKPVALMRWLVRLVTPPGGLVLDPFAGSGTTGIAAALEGFRFVGMEQNPAYAAIAEARIAHWSAQPTIHTM